jgi:hypothetical protein
MHDHAIPGAPKHSPGHHRSEQHTPSSKRAKRTERQIPPFLEMAIELVFINGGRDFIKVAATGIDPNLGGIYAQNTEYWYAKATSVASMTSISMTLARDTFTAEQLNAFFSGFTKAFTDPEVVTQASWTQGQYTPPAGTTARMFRAPDPDDGTKYIGLVIAQDSTKKLKATAWYKTVQPADGSVWTAANMPVDNGLTWSLVRDGNGNPTLNPNFIQSNQTWYHHAQS